MTSLSRPAQASLALRPAGSLNRLKAAFVTRLQPGWLPSKTARQLPGPSTTSWVEPSSTGNTRRRGARRVEEERGGVEALPMAPFLLPAHQTGRADFPHPAFRPASLQGLTAAVRDARV